MDTAEQPVHRAGSVSPGEVGDTDVRICRGARGAAVLCEGGTGTAVPGTAVQRYWPARGFAGTWGGTGLRLQRPVQVLSLGRAAVLGAWQGWFSAAPAAAPAPGAGSAPAAGGWWVVGARGWLWCLWHSRGCHCRTGTQHPDSVLNGCVLVQRGTCVLML